MRIRATSLLSAAALLVLPAFHSSCGSATGVGSPRAGEFAAVMVRSDNEPIVRQAIRAVFTDAGFQYDVSTASSLEFRKRGNRSAEIAWTTINNPNPVWIRPSVGISRTGDGFRLTCDVYVTQASTTWGETVRQPLLAGRSGYQRLLNDVRKRVEKGR